MTTIACNREVMAADRQITHGCQKFPSAKVFRIKHIIVGAAGDGEQGEEFLEWLRGRRPQPDDLDDIEALVLKSAGIFLYAGGACPIRVSQRFYAIGSGAQAALAAMHLGADPVEAVKIAAKIDPHTGYGVSYKRLT